MIPITLATAWNPRGELARFVRLHAQMAMVYDQIVITLPPDVADSVVQALVALPKVRVIVTEAWSAGRYMALQGAYESGTGFIHYADCDRLLRWVETRPEEWQTTVQQVTQTECLVIGRTPTAWATHPQALVKTEAISNAVFSHLLGQPLDLSAGSKGFSRAVVGVLLANTTPYDALGVDSEWVVLAYRAGFRVTAVCVDGLDWETADRHQAVAADAAEQHQVAQAYDTDATRWQMRVAVADEIIRCGLAAWDRTIQDGMHDEIS